VGGARTSTSKRLNGDFFDSMINEIRMCAYSGGNCATYSGDTVPPIPGVTVPLIPEVTVPLIPEVIVPLFMMLTSLKKMSDGRTKNKHHGFKTVSSIKKGGS
jgi:hypothetical protein